MISVNASNQQQEDQISKSAIAEQYMDNTTPLDVFDASIYGDRTGRTEADFDKHVLPKAKQAILQEGDLLFMPPK